MTMTLLDHPAWPYLVKFIHIPEGRDNVDLLDVPDDLRAIALEVVCNCISCGAVIKPLRARAKSSRSRIANTAVERRMFYAPTCPSERDAGCARSKAARQHKAEFLKMFGRTGNNNSNANRPCL